MILRRSIADDASAICALEDEIFPDGWSNKDVLYYICVEGGMCYSALTDSGELIGYILGRTIAPEGEIYRIAVAPAYRRRGIGYRLLDYAVKTERGRGLERLMLEVRSTNLAARKLYRSYGFIDIGVRRNYYKNPTEDAIVMLRAHSQDMIN